MPPRRSTIDRCRALILIFATFAVVLPGNAQTLSMKSNPHRYLALGDSYTIGESVPPGERWPVQLVARLRERGVEIANPEIIAETGWTTGDLMNAIDQADPQAPFELVTLLIGVNNQFRGLALNAYRIELAALIQRAIEFAGAERRHVILLSIPDWGVTPFATGRNGQRIAADIDRFNQTKREEAKRAGVRFIDITDISRRAEQDTDLLAQDGPSPLRQDVRSLGRTAGPPDRGPVVSWFEGLISPGGLIYALPSAISSES